jgi:hypothetical protein
MFAAPPEHPLTQSVFLTVWLAGIVLLVGAVLARRWRGVSAVWVRSVVGLIALGVPVAFEVFAPAGGLEGAGRILFLWPFVVLDVLFFAIWVWRGRASAATD